MNNIIKQIEVDVYSPTFYEVIKAQQGDKNSRFVEFILFNQGDPYTIPDNTIVKLEGSRPNKSPVIKPDTIEDNIITIKDNIITVELDEDLLYYAGISHLKIVLYDTSDHSVLSTIPFTLSVQKNPLNSDKFEKDNYSLLNQLILQTETANQNLEKHISDTDDPHTIIYEEPDTLSKLTVGEKLSDTFGKLSKAVSDLITHINDNIRHITSTERENWDDAYNKRHIHFNKDLLDNISASYTSEEKNKLDGIQDGAQINVQSDWNISDSDSDAYIRNKPPVYTRNEIDNKFSALETNIDWKESVDTFDDIASVHQNPQDGWTVNVKDTDYTYRYNGTEWIPISANAIPKATNFLDGLLSKEDHASYEDANSKKHSHSNKSVIDKITQTLLDSWNAAYSHISDNIKHTTSAEKTLWNTVSNKVDKSGDTMTGILYNKTPTDDIRSTSMSSNGFFNHVPRTGYAGGMTWVDQDRNEIGTMGLWKDNYYYLGKDFRNPEGVLKLNKVIGNLDGNSKGSETLQGHPADRFTKQYNATPQANEMNPNEICTLGYDVNTMLQNETDNPTKKKGWYHIWSQSWSKSPDNWVSQIAIDVQKNSGMYYRNSLAEKSIVGRPWVKLLDEKNFYNYTKKIGVATGIGGTAGYVNFARITINESYINSTIKIEIGGRGRTLSTNLFIMFQSVNNTDPDLKYFRKTGDKTYPIWINKTATSTWDLYAPKNEPYGLITVFDLKMPFTGTIVEFPDAQVTSIGESWIEASPGNGLENTRLGDWVNNKSWADAGEITTKAEYFLRSYRIDNNFKQGWAVNGFSSAIVFGGHDTRGAISMPYDRAEIRFTGGNKSSYWQMSIKGTPGKTYNLDNITNSGLIEETIISDERDKTDFENIDSEKALAFIENINPVSFVYNLRDSYAKDMNDYTDEEWDNYNKYGFKPYDKKSHSTGNKKDKRRRVGVNAQEILENINNIYGSLDVNNIVNDNLYNFKDIPESIENQYSINYKAFIPYLISAIQELSTIVKEQANRIEQLENYLK